MELSSDFVYGTGKRIIKNFSVILIFFSIIFFFSAVVSAADINDTFHINLQTTYSNGSIQTGTFAFAFNVTENSNTSCLGPVVYNHSESLTTDTRGIISLYLPTSGSAGGNLSSLDFNKQYYLCYYRDGVLKDVTQLGRVPYAFRASEINLSEISIDSNLTLGSFNISASSGFFSFLGDLTNRITTLFVQDINATGDINTTRNVSASWFLGSINASNVVNAPWLSSFSETDSLAYNGTLAYNLTLTNMWSAFLNTTNLSYLTIDRWNATNTSYRTLDNLTFSGTSTFNGGWQNNGVSIINGDIFAQTMYVYNISSLSVSNLNVNGSMLPYFDSQFDLGNATFKWRDLAVGRNTILGNNLTVSGGALFVDNGTGNVGIGTTSPGHVLHVQGATDPVIAVGTDTNNKAWMRWNTAGTYLDFTTRQGSTYYADTLVLKSGNVGIGTVAPNNTLHVRGTINASQILVNNTAVMTIGQWNATNASYALNQTLTDMWSPFLNTTNLSYLTIDRFNVTNTSYALNQTLTDMWSPFLNTTNLSYLMIDRFNVTNTSYRTLTNVTFANSLLVQTTSPQLNLSSSDGSFSYIKQISGSGGVLVLQNTSGSENVTIRAYGDSYFNAGNVGIGTTGPTSKLDVVGQNFTLTGASGDNTSFTISDQAGPSVAGFRIKYNDATGDTKLQNIYDNAAGDIYIQTKVAGTAIDALFIESAGNIGIGTTSPTEKLQVVGAVAINSTLAAHKTSALTLAQDSSTTSQIRAYGANATTPGQLHFLGMANDGAPQWDFFINSTGLVGIGTTNPGVWDTERLTIKAVDTGGLAVVGSDYVASTTGSMFGVRFGANSGNTYTELRGLQAGGSGWNNLILQSGGGNVGIGTVAPNNTLHVRGTINASQILVNNTAVMTAANWNATNESYLKDYGDTATGNYTFDAGTFFIDSTNDKIGIGTTSPSNLLTVEKASTAGLAKIYNTAGTITDGQAILEVRSDDVSDPAAHDLLNLNNGGTVRLLVQADGAIGIGTTSPVNTLHINATTDVIRMTNPGTGVASSDGMFIGHSAASATSFDFWNYEDNYLRFATNNAERVRIDSSGNVGINTTTPQSALQVFGTSGTPSGTAGTAAILSLESGSGTDLVFGGMGSSPYTAWIQHRHATNNNNYYDLSLQPLGGNVGINTTTPQNTLNIKGGFNVSNVSGVTVLFVNDTFPYVGIGTTGVHPTESQLTIKQNADDATGGIKILQSGPASSQDKVLATYFDGTSWTFATGYSSGGTKSDIQFLNGVGGSPFLTFAQSTSYTGVRTPVPNATLNIFASGNASFLINNATNAHLFVNGTTGRVGVGLVNPGAMLHVYGTYGTPSYVNASFIVGSGSAGTGLYFGQDGLTSPYPFWMQTNVIGSDATHYPLSLNPLGGNVSIGTSIADQKFVIPNNDFYSGVRSQGDVARRLIGITSGNIVSIAPDGQDVVFTGGSKVGIGTVAPNNTLHVFGTINASQILVNNTAVMTIGQWNATNASYALNQTLTDMWSPFLNTTNLSYLTIDRFNVTNTSYALNQTLTNMWTAFLSTTNTSYLMIDRFNVTNTSYRTLTNLTFIGDALFNLTGPNNDLSIINSTSNASLFFINGTFGRIGIGTTSPGAKLEVYSGTADVESKVHSDSGNAQLTLDAGGGENADSILSFKDDGTEKWRIFYDATAAEAAKLKIQDDGDVRVTFDQSGNVGIGTTTPSATLNVFNSLGNASFLINNATNTHFFVNGTTGNVGIGTVSPSDTLVVKGQTSGTTVARIMGYVTNVSMGTNGDLIAYLNLTGYEHVSYTGGSKIIVGSDDLVIGNTNVVSGSGNYNPSIQVSSEQALNFLTGGTSRLFIANSSVNAGNVGINTTVPAGQLHINGTGTGARLILQKGTAASANNIEYRDNTGTTKAYLGIAETTNGGVTGSVLNDFYIRVETGQKVMLATNGGDAKGITIDSSGNVGIATTSPTQRFDVNGNATIGGTLFVNNISNFVGIGTTSPTTGLHVKGADPIGYATIEKTGVNGAGSVGVMSLLTDAKTANDAIILNFGALDSGSASQGYSQFITKIISPTAGSETSEIQFWNMKAGTLTQQMTIDTNGTLTAKLPYLSMDYHVDSGSPAITAGDIVSYINGNAEKAHPSISFGSPTTGLNGGQGVYAALLNSTRFVIAYSNATDTGTLWAVAADVVGTTVTYGAPVLINNSGGIGATSVRIAALNSTRFIVGFQNGNNNYPYAVMGDVASSRVITNGSTSSYFHNQTTTTGTQAIVGLNGTKFVMAYRDASNGFGAYTVGSISGTTVTNATNYFWSPTTSVTGVNLAPINSTNFLLTYAGIGNALFALVGNVAGTALSNNTQVQISGMSGAASVGVVNSTQFVVATGGSSYVNAAVLNVSGVNVQYGTVKRITADASAVLTSTAILDTTHFVVAYTNATSLSAVTNTVSGTTITNSTPKFVSLTGSSHMDVVNISSTTFAIAYQNSSSWIFGIVGTSFGSLSNTVLGMAVNNASAGGTVQVASNGVVSGLSGLTAGSTYYWGVDTGLTTTATPYRVGLATSTSSILLNSGANGSNATDQFFGDMVFTNAFRITEAQDNPQALLFKNHINQQILSLDENGNLASSGSINAGTNLNVAGEFNLTSDAFFNKLIGSGNAYACLDAAGKLYRSQTPCV